MHIEILVALDHRDKMAPADLHDGADRRIRAGTRRQSGRVKITSTASDS
jgi:hypothetical protein